MPFKTPSYSYERSQRERAKQAKAQTKSDLRAEKSARRKEVRGEGGPEAKAVAAGQFDDTGQ